MICLYPFVERNPPTGVGGSKIGLLGFEPSTLCWYRAAEASRRVSSRCRLEQIGDQKRQRADAGSAFFISMLKETRRLASTARK